MTHSADIDLESRALAAFKVCCDVPDAELEGTLARLCGADPALRARVERLLAADRLGDEAGQGGQAAKALDGGHGRKLLLDDLVSSMRAGEEEAEPLPELLGPYRVVAVLGAGSMGLVYEAEQARPRRRVAVKTVHPHLLTDAVVDRFRREVELLGSLGHPAIPQVYEAGEEGDTAWLAMELVRGRRLLEHTEGLPVGARITLMIEIIDGVAFAHDAGIIHCDLNPDNVLITADGQPKILDFGLALSPRATSGATTAPGEAPAPGVGFSRRAVSATNAFIAPEQREGEALLDARVDVFALGRLLAVTFAGPIPRAIRRELDAIVARATATSPAHRYPSARELADELRRVASREPTRANPGSPLHRLRLMLARNRQAVRAVAFVLSAALLVGVGAFVWEAIGERRAEAQARTRLETVTRRVAELEAAGDRHSADAVFDLYTRMVDNLGTEALHDAWVWRAEREAALGPTGRTIEAWAEAVTSAPSREAESRALTRLADAFASAGQWRPLDHVLGRLNRLGHFEAHADTLSLRLRTATYHRRFAEAAALDSRHGAAPVVRAFSRAQPLGAGLQFVAPMRWRGQELLLTRAYDSPVARLLDPRAGLKVVASATLGASATAQLPRPLVGADGLVIALGADGQALLRPFEGGPELALPLRRVHRTIAWTAGDEGTRLMAVLGSAGDERGLVSVAARSPLGASTPSITRAPPAVGAPASDVDALVRADFDGDGTLEVVAALGAWGAYDLRVFRVSPEGAFTPVTRRRLGVVGGLAVLPVPGAPPLIAAAKADRYPSVTTFGPATPYGPPAGVYLFALVGDRLEERGFLPLPEGLGTVHELREPLAGDFDGDGLTDLALGISLLDGQLTLLMRQVTPGELVPIMVRDAMARAVVQVDPDPADELLVDVEDDGATTAWLLGAGEDRLPPLGPSTGPGDRLLGEHGARRQSLEGDDPALERVWQGARTLRELGLLARAADNLEAASMLAGSDTLEALVLSEAAALRLELGDARPAALLFDRAVSRAHPGTPDHLDALAGAARSWLAAVEPALALERYRRLIAATSPPSSGGGLAAAASGDAPSKPSSEAAALRRGAERQVAFLTGLLASETSARRFDWRGRIGPPLVVVAPGSIARTAGGGLAARVFSDQDVIARIPVRYSGGRIAVEVDLELSHLEIGAGLHVALRPRGMKTSELSLQVEARGGDQSIVRSAVCGTPGTGTRGIEGERPIDAAPERLRLRVDHWPLVPAGDASAQGSRAWCQIWQGDAANPYHAVLGPSAPLAPGDYDLVLSGTNVTSLVSLTEGRFVISRLELIGLTEDDHTPSPLELAHLAYVNGDWAAARDAWKSLPEGHRFALFADLQLGDADQLAQSLATRLHESPGADPVLAHALRTHRARLTPLIQALDPVDFAARFAYSWGIAHRYTALGEVREALLDPTLEHLAADSLDALRIIAARAELLFQLGELERAYVATSRALAAPPTDHPGGLALLAQCELLAARIALGRGDPTAARTHIRRWRDRLPLPELALERLNLDPADAPLIALL